MPNDQAPSEDMFLEFFNDPEKAAVYAKGPELFVPGQEALHRMSGLLLAERAPANARILVLGAGGGVEISALAETYPDWRFVGVDPAIEMLRQAERVLGPHMDRVELVKGYIDDAPQGPFDAAICLLTLHFLDQAERIRTVRGLHERLRPDAPFVAAHVSFPQGATREIWLDRYASYPIAMGADPDLTRDARAAVAAGLNIFDPERDEAVLRAGGFRDISQFYSGFVWRGWVGYA